MGRVLFFLHERFECGEIEAAVNSGLVVKPINLGAGLEKFDEALKVREIQVVAVVLVSFL